MEPKIIFLYIYALRKNESLKSAIGEEVDDFGQENYWFGVELVHRSYKLSVRDTNEFIKKYLIK